MKKNILIKIKVGIFICVLSLIYFFCDPILDRHENLGFSLSKFLYLLSNYWHFIILASFILVFIYPYIKIHSGSVFKRGLFFGIIIWVIHSSRLIVSLISSPLLLMQFQQYVLRNISIDPFAAIPALLSFIANPLYFIILGLAISFSYKKFLPTEFNLNLRKIKIPFIKIIFAFVLSAPIYFLLMFFVQILIFYTAGQISITYLPNPLFYINPLIYGLIFVTLYSTTIGRADISKTRRLILFSLFLYSFTVPLVILPIETMGEFFRVHPLTFRLLGLFHLLSIFVVGYIFTKILNGVYSTGALSKIKE